MIAGRRLEPPRHYVPGSGEFVRAISLGLGWGMVSDLQTADGNFVDLDPEGQIDVALYWQQWRLRTTALDRVTVAVRHAAADRLQ